MSPRRQRPTRIPGSPWGLLLVLLTVAANAVAADWRLAGDAERSALGPALLYAKRVAVRSADGQEVAAHLAFFTSRAYRLTVIDLGAGTDAATPALAEAFRSATCLAGVNGGYFHANGQPLGLVIAQGRRINRFETAKLLSGVVYSDDRGLHLVRRSRFRDHPGITALLQTGPYLVEDGRTVRGLSTSATDRRTFIATDWRGHWVLGATLNRVTLADLAESLASPESLTPWRVDRAINLDGGSSSGFFFERGEDQAPVTLTPWKRVHNLLGIVSR